MQILYIPACSQLRLQDGKLHHTIVKNTALHNAKDDDVDGGGGGGGGGGGDLLVCLMSCSIADVGDEIAGGLAAGGTAATRRRE
jgi:hypothetical protein